jgi:hypothetical protein
MREEAMKLKTLFIMFNCVVVFFLVVVGIMPIVMKISMDTQYLPLALLVILVLAGLDVYYFFNYRLLSLLEKDDWPALIQYLEGKVLKKGRFSQRSVHLLTQTYLIMSDTASAVNLENKTAVASPRLVEKNALVFGAARLLAKDISGAEKFFEAHLKTAPKKDRLWIRFYYGFSLLLDWRFQEGSGEFMDIVKSSNNPVLTGLSAWFLFDFLNKALPDQRADIAAAAEEGKAKAKAAIYDLEEWKVRVLKLQREVHVALHAKSLNDAGKWLWDK